MIRLFFIAYYHTVRLTFGFLSQFAWFQTYMGWVQWLIVAAVKLWAWWTLFVLIGWLFWDVLPLVALGFMAFHAYRWRRREAW